jgi:hypothetical protein
MGTSLADITPRFALAAARPLARMARAGTRVLLSLPSTII